MTVRPPSAEHLSFITAVNPFCVAVAVPALTVTTYQTSYVPKTAPPAVSVLITILFSVPRTSKIESKAVITVKAVSLSFLY